MAADIGLAGEVPRHTSAPPRRPRFRRDRVAALALLAPAGLLYLTFVIVPWLHSVWISFYEWDGIGASRWVGLDNYVDVFTEDVLVASFLRALGFIAFYSVVPVALGLVLAAVLASRRRRGESVVRTLLFLPQILPLVAVGVIWRYVYSEDGPLNQALGAVGLEQLQRAWLGDFTFAYIAVGLVGTWVATGLCTILMLSGIQKIDLSLYEAARLDGAGAFGEFRHVTLPGLRREIIVALTVTMIAALASFDVVYVTTGGGPGHSTTVPGVLIYQLVFTANRVGTACALAVVLSVSTLVLVALLNRLGREKP